MSRKQKCNVLNLSEKCEIIHKYDKKTLIAKTYGMLLSFILIILITDSEFYWS